MKMFGKKKVNTELLHVLYPVVRDLSRKYVSKSLSSYASSIKKELNANVSSNKSLEAQDNLKSLRKSLQQTDSLKEVLLTSEQAYEVINSIFKETKNTSSMDTIQEVMLITKEILILATNEKFNQKTIQGITTILGEVIVKLSKLYDKNLQEVTDRVYSLDERVVKLAGE